MTERDRPIGSAGRASPTGEHEAACFSDPAMEGYKTTYEGMEAAAMDNRSVPENLAQSLRVAFGGVVSVEVVDGLLQLTIGRHLALLDGAGDLVGEANYSAVEEVMT